MTRIPQVTDDDGFRADWAAGMSLAELGVKYGITVTTASNTARRLGCPKRCGGVNKDALSGGEWVADDHGILRWVPAPGVVHPRNAVVTEIDEDEFREIWATGLPVRAIARHFHCSPSRVNDIARRLGCPYRRGQVSA